VVTADAAARADLVAGVADRAADWVGVLVEAVAEDSAADQVRLSIREGHLKMEHR
jgi:hypothetical protein